MKLRDSRLNWAVAVALVAALGACSGSGFAGSEPLPAVRSIANGPAADYPVVIGDPFVIAGVTYTPVDTMNYDEVGYAAAGEQSALGVTAAHRTLPLPSYVEVTALETGRTALVRVERRGPMTNDRLIALSAPALAQLGLSDGAPVRVRRVNPPEDHRAELRAQREAPLRMDTPTGLLEVLRRKLPAAGAATLTDPRQAQVSGLEPDEATLAMLDPRAEAQPASPPAPTVPPPAVTRAEPTDAEQASAPVADRGNFVVQIGAFSVRANADRLAEKVSGYVETSGRLALVRLGPFTTRGQAEQALAKVRAQGYSDAQIQTVR